MTAGTPRRAGLVVVGDCCVDVVLAGGAVAPIFGDVEQIVGRGTLTIGGSATITACSAARLGVSTRLAAHIGADPAGELLIGLLRGRGVDTDDVRRDPAAATGVTVNLSRAHDRAILTAPGALALLCVDDLRPGLLATAAHLHVGSYFLQPTLQPGLPGLFASAKRDGVSVSVDPGWDPAGLWDRILDVLEWVDVLFVNDAEGAAIAGRITGAGAPAERHDVLAVLGEWCPTVVVKHGARGATASTGGERVTVPAPAVDVVDSIGAGDSFAAGYLHAWLAAEGLVTCTAYGCAAATLSTRADGGVDGQGDHREVAALAEQLAAQATDRSSR